MKPNNTQNTFLLQCAFFSVLLFSSIVFTSCGGDDSLDENSFLETLCSNKWVSRDVWFGTGNDDHAWLDEDTEYLYFKKDHTGVLYMSRKSNDTHLGSSRSSNYLLFDYTVSGNTVRVSYEDGTYASYIFKNGDLWIEGSSTLFYSPIKMTAADYSFLATLGPTTKSSGDIKYTYDDRSHVLTISGNGYMPDYTTSTQPWKDLYVMEIIVKEGVKSIGNRAFKDMYAVTKVTLPQSLERIGTDAFSNLILLLQINIPKNVTEIGESAFAGCKILKNVRFGDGNGGNSIKTIGDWAFSDANVGSADLIFPNLEVVGHNFALSGSFNHIVIGKNIKSIGNFAFSTSAEKGTIEIASSVPPTAYNYVVSDQEQWTLKVPKGATNNYKNAAPWKSFKSIIE